MFGDSGELRDRVKRLRLIRRWDQGKLATQAGLTQPIISRIESGRGIATDEQVGSIAEALGYSQKFVGATLDLVPTTRPWLRAYADASRKEALARTAWATTAAEYIRQLDLVPLPDLIPRFNGQLDDDEAIDEAADELRGIAGIDSDSVVANAIRAAERIGCVVLPLDSEMGRHFGMSVRSDQMPMICVANHGVSGDRQRFTIAHELGHLMLHADYPPPQDSEQASRMEKQANRFASSFLAPGDALIETLEEFGSRVSLRTLGEIKAVWGISIKALVGRFQTLGIIDSDHARSLYKQISARHWTKLEPVHVPTESAQWFMKSTLRKAGVEDLNTATRLLSSLVGGNAIDMWNFANWEPAKDAEVVSIFSTRRVST